MRLTNLSSFLSNQIKYNFSKKFTLFQTPIFFKDAIRLKRVLEQFLHHAPKALVSTVVTGSIIDQVKKAKNAGPKPIDPEILGKNGGFSRPVWKELARRQKQREAVEGYQEHLMDKADFSEAFGK
jgi:hypothetical protein